MSIKIERKIYNYEDVISFLIVRDQFIKELNISDDIFTAILIRLREMMKRQYMDYNFYIYIIESKWVMMTKIRSFYEYVIDNFNHFKYTDYANVNIKKIVLKPGREFPLDNNLIMSIPPNNYNNNFGTHSSHIDIFLRSELDLFVHRLKKHKLFK